MAKLKKTASLALAAVLASNCLEAAAEIAKNSDRTKLLSIRASDREKWKTAGPKSRRALIFKNHIAQAEKVLKEPIPQPTASLFMEFMRTGNRANYEAVFFARRKNLVTLVIAECAEYKGRFLDRIADYLWEITAEHTWCLPAHIPAKYNDGLPELPYEIVDLFAAETGMDLALTLNLLEDELKKVSPHLVAEVRRQLIRHIIEPVEIKPFPFWWLKSTNNWRPWCCSNVLIVALTVLNDQPERQRKLIAMLKDAVDDFVKIFRAWLQETHATPKGGRIHRGKSPAEIWAARPARTAFSDEELAFAFLRPVGVRVVGRGPSVTLNGTQYYSDEVAFGEKVLVKTSQRDPAMVLLCNADGTVRGIARTREAVKAITGDDATQRELLSARIARQRHQSAKVVRMLQQLTGGQYGVSVIEYMMTLGTDQRFVKRDAILKVKGKEHHYQRLAPEKPVFSLPEFPADLPSGPDIEEAEPEVQEAQAILARPEIHEDEPDDLTDIHNFITNHKKGEDEE